MIIGTGQFIQLGLFIFIFSQSLLLSVRFSKAFATIERQGQELFGINLAMTQEIDMRKKTEEALKTSEEKYTVCSLRTPQKRFSSSRTDFVRFHNTRTEELTGYEAGEICSDSLSRLTCTPMTRRENSGSAMRKG